MPASLDLKMLWWWPLAIATASLGLLATQLANDANVGFAVLATLALFFILAIVPWLALRATAVWWLATAGGAVAGLIIGLMVSFGMMTGGACGLGCPLANAIGLALGFAICGGAQALTLPGSARKLTWLVVSLLAAVALSFSIAWLPQPSAPASIGTIPLKTVLIGGLAWGTVVGLGLTIIGPPFRGRQRVSRVSG